VLTHDVDGRAILDNDTTKSVAHCSEGARIVCPVARGVCRIPVAIGTKARLSTAGAVASKSLKRSHNGAPRLLNGIIRRQVGELEFLSRVWCRIEFCSQPRAEDRVAQHPEQPHDFTVKVVIDIHQRRARLAHQNRPSAAERLRVDPMRGKVRNDPRGEHPLAAVIAQHRA
jgi:hypothetical protein